MLRSLTSRRMLPVVLLTSAALALTGCGGADDKPKAKPTTKASAKATVAPGSCDYPSGDTSDAVKVKGDFGQTLSADFKTPLEATSLERTIIDEGDGDKTAKGDQVNVVISAFIGKDGKALATQPTKFKVGSSSLPAAFDAAISCVPLGSRVAVTVPAGDVYGDAGNPQLGITSKDTMVIVADVQSKVKLIKPEAWTSNVPKVTFAKDGTPKVVIPAGKASPKLLLKVLKKGNGVVVGNGDKVTLNYQGTSWEKKKIFDQSYGGAPATFATDEVVEGFGAALVGQKVGTRLIVSIPPKYGYGEGKIGSGNLVGETLVFVIEIQNATAS